MERARKGVARPIFYKGEQVGEWRDFDERLTVFLLRFRRRHRFSPEADTLPRVFAEIAGEGSAEQIPFDPEGELDGRLDALEFLPLPPDDDEPESATDEEQ